MEYKIKLAFDPELSLEEAEVSEDGMLVISNKIRSLIQSLLATITNEKFGIPYQITVQHKPSE